MKLIRSKVKKCDDDTRWLSDFRDITRELILIQFPWKIDKDILKKLKIQVRRISGTITGLKEDIAMRERLEKLK